jgi:hypothetical protein
VLARVALLVVCVSTSACSDEGRSVAPRGLRGAGAPAASAAPQVAPGPRAAEDHAAPRWDRAAERAPESSVAPAPSNVAPVADEASAPERDLDAELRQGLGDPLGCLSNVAALPSRIRMTFSAVVSLSGRVTRVEVTAPGLPDADLDCLRRRALAVRFREPVEEAPRAASATLEAVYHPAGSQEAPAEPAP